MKSPAMGDFRNGFSTELLKREFRPASAEPTVVDVGTDRILLIMFRKEQVQKAFRATHPSGNVSQ